MTSTKPMDKASAAFKKQEQQREGAKAMAEYQAGLVAEQKKTEKLRALRLAHEAGVASEAPQATAKQKSNTRREKSRAKRGA